MKNFPSSENCGNSNSSWLDVTSTRRWTLPVPTSKCWMVQKKVDSPRFVSDFWQAIRSVLPSGANNTAFIDGSDLNQVTALPVAVSHRRTPTFSPWVAATDPSKDAVTRANPLPPTRHRSVPSRAIAPGGSGSPYKSARTASAGFDGSPAAGGSPRPVAQCEKVSTARDSRRCRERRMGDPSRDDYSINHFNKAFCACNRLPACWNTTLCAPSSTASVTSSPRCAGKQCMIFAVGGASANNASLT